LSRTILLLFLSQLLLPVGAALCDDADATDAAVVRAGTKSLPGLLKEIDSKDADKRIRARRLATRIALGYYRRAAPAGMKLVHHRVKFTVQSVSLPDAFYLSATEVTRAQFARFAKANSLPTKDQAWSKGAPTLPIVWISFHQAAAYAKSKKARLPTIEELARAATSFGRLAYPWGDQFDPRYLNSQEARAGMPKPPGSFPLGRSRAGIDDLLGNVAEWTSSSTGKTKRRRIFGGSWRTSLAGKRPPFQVNRMAKTARDQDVGFRLAKSLPTSSLPVPASPASSAPASSK
jgi:hypothetical protein